VADGADHAKAHEQKIAEAIDLAAALASRVHQQSSTQPHCYGTLIQLFPEAGTRRREKRETTQPQLDRMDSEQAGYAVALGGLVSCRALGRKQHSVYSHASSVLFILEDVHQLPGMAEVPRSAGLPTLSQVRSTLAQLRSAKHGFPDVL
jgi:hypothetical protein